MDMLKPKPEESRVNYFTYPAHLPGDLSFMGA
jgi:hypothetical protein